MKRSYTQEQIAKCRREYSKGKTLTQISLEQGIPRTTIGNWLKRYNGLPIYLPGYPYCSHKIYRQDEHLKKLEDTVAVSLLMVIEKFYDFFFLNGVFIYFVFLFIVVIRATFYL